MAIAASDDGEGCADDGGCQVIAKGRSSYFIIAQRMNERERRDFEKATGACVGRNEVACSIPIALAEAAGLTCK